MGKKNVPKVAVGYLYHMLKFASILLAVFAISLLADEIYLRNGNMIEGKVIRKEKDKVVVEFQMGSSIGQIEFYFREIDSIVYRKITSTDRALAQFRKMKKTARTLDDWLNLGQWCQKQPAFDREARECFEAAVALDPMNVPANEALGRISYQGRWMSFEEKMQLMGNVFYDGEWMPSERADALRRGETLQETPQQTDPEAPTSVPTPATETSPKDDLTSEEEQAWEKVQNMNKRQVLPDGYHLCYYGIAHPAGQYCGREFCSPEFEQKTSKHSE